MWLLRLHGCRELDCSPPSHPTLQLVGRGSERDSRGSRSSAGGSITSSGPHSLPLGPSPAQSPLTRSGQQPRLTSSGPAAAGQTRTDLAKLPPGFADSEFGQ